MMFNRWLLLCLLVLGSSLQAANDRLLFWEVDNGRGTTWLLGSMHLARADIYPLRREISAAFELSDQLVVEVDIGGANQLAIQQRMLEVGTYAAGESIADDLSPQTWKSLQARLETSGLPVIFLEQLNRGW